MAAIFTAGRTTDFDGSGAADTATGPIVVTFKSNALAVGKPLLRLFSRSGTAGYVETHKTSESGRFIANLASGDDYYFTVNIPTGATADLDVVAQ